MDTAPCTFPFHNDHIDCFLQKHHTVSTKFLHAFIILFRFYYIISFLGKTASCIIYSFPAIRDNSKFHEKNDSKVGFVVVRVPTRLQEEVFFFLTIIRIRDQHHSDLER